MQSTQGKVRSLGVKLMIAKYPENTLKDKNWGNGEVKVERGTVLETLALLLWARAVVLGEKRLILREDAAKGLLALDEL